MKFLIAGLGSAGRRHLRNLLAQGENDVFLLRSHKATLPEADLAGFPVETELEKALAHRPDAVIIANPTALHLEVAHPAAQAGCHILLEKPISHTMEGVDALVETAKTNGVRTLVGFQLRYHPTIRKVKGWLDAGEIGIPLSFCTHWGEYLPDWHPWEDYRDGYAARADLGGGVIRTLCHPLDYLRMLFGEVGSLWCFTGSRGLALPVEDTAEIGLHFENGVLGTVHLNYNQRPPRNDFEIVGTGGTIRWDHYTAAAKIYRAERGEWETALPPTGFERNDLFVAEMANFLGMVRENELPVCSLDDGVAALKLALAALNSAKSGTRIQFS